MRTEKSVSRAALVPPPPPPEATGVVTIFERRRTLIEDPRGAASDAAERVLTYSLLQGASMTCSGVALWAFAVAEASPRAGYWLVVATGLLALLLALVAWGASRRAATAARSMTATGSEPRHAEVVASREAKRDLVVVRIAAIVAPAYVVLGVARLQPASLPLLCAAAIFGFAAIRFARRTADRLGSARYATRVIGRFREDRAN